MGIRAQRTSIAQVSERTERDAVSAAHHQRRLRAISESDSWRKVSLLRIAQRQP